LVATTVYEPTGNIEGETTKPEQDSHVHTILLSLSRTVKSNNSLASNPPLPSISIAPSSPPLQLTSMPVSIGLSSSQQVILGDMEYWLASVSTLHTLLTQDPLCPSVNIARSMES